MMQRGQTLIFIHILGIDLNLNLHRVQKGPYLRCHWKACVYSNIELLWWSHCQWINVRVFVSFPGVASKAVWSAVTPSSAEEPTLSTVWWETDNGLRQRVRPSFKTLFSEIYFFVSYCLSLIYFTFLPGQIKGEFQLFWCYIIEYSFSVGNSKRFFMRSICSNVKGLRYFWSLCDRFVWVHFFKIFIIIIS